MSEKTDMAITQDRKYMNKNTDLHNIHVNMRLIGYYMSEDQFMRTESILPEEAEQLAALLDVSYQSLLNNRFADDAIRSILKGNTVLILKGENNNLYGYYPRYKIARITKVRYSKDVVVPFPLKYKRWFLPGEKIRLIHTEETLYPQTD